ncbi:MAG: cytochrome c oxidase assembly protein [Nocardioidaceae bacterium]|nr:cytochrome c oxidase assembly protein [Nocardioidaceae bacterium]
MSVGSPGGTPTPCNIYAGVVTDQAADAPRELPPAISWEQVFSAWTFEPAPIAAVVVVGLAYCSGVWALRRRGDRWPPSRTATFLGGGLVSMLVATCSSLAAYDTVLLSMHMVQHMVLSMVAPIFLALGAPVTLALRSLPQRPRRLLLRLLHSRLATVVSFPPVTLALFIVSPWVLYFSGWYPATLESAALHQLLHLHFVLVGCLFFWPLLGLDPVPGRVAYPLRVLTVFATLPFHAFLGVTIMAMREVIAGDWYYSLPRDWPPSPMDDQHLAGGILWGFGDIVGLVMLGVLFVQWVRSSNREAAHEDRRLDREQRADGAAAESRGEAAAPLPKSGL